MRKERNKVRELSRTNITAGKSSIHCMGATGGSFVLGAVRKFI